MSEEVTIARAAKSSARRNPRLHVPNRPGLADPGGLRLMQSLGVWADRCGQNTTEATALDPRSGKRPTDESTISSNHTIRDVHGRAVPTPWEGRHTSYEKTCALADSDEG